MLLTLTTTRQPAIDLGYLLQKHPGKVQSFDVSGGKAHVFYPEASETRTTAALLLDLDPIGLTRRDTRGGDFALEAYVNDRPYISSSWLATAISGVYASAMNGNCRDKPGLPNEAWPFVAHIPVVSVRGGEGLLRKLFEPLGYEVAAEQAPLDEQFPDWGPSRYWSVTLSATCRLQDLLTHLYVLLPVLDNDQHYYVGKPEVDKLLAKGAGWLDKHPENALIVRRYLNNQGKLAKTVMNALLPEETEEEPEEAPAPSPETEAKLRLHEVRLQTACARLRESGAASVLDLGCGEGKLLRLLAKEKQFRRITGMDVSIRALEIAADKLNMSRLPDREKERFKLFHGSLTYRDSRLEGYDAAALVEVIEHVDPGRLPALERSVFQYARPRTVVVTTPRADFNAKYESLAEGAFRHSDHRFEWTEAEFQQWCAGTGERFGYDYSTEPVGEFDPEFGAPSQMAVFTRKEVIKHDGNQNP